MDEGLLLLKDVFNRILNGDNVLSTRLVDAIDERSQGR